MLKSEGWKRQWYFAYYGLWIVVWPVSFLFIPIAIQNIWYSEELRRSEELRLHE